MRAPASQRWIGALLVDVIRVEVVAFVEKG
jgi:hypothetical protein